MYDVCTTPGFRKWLKGLPDRRAKALLTRRVERLAAGHTGDHRFLGASLHELRVHIGPGYRIYFTRRGVRTVVLLAGGDKSSQQADIARARAMIDRLEVLE